MNTRLLMASVVGLLVLIGSGVSVFAAEAERDRPSVLFINIDDLNDWNEVLGGHPQAITPNIQRLAERGTTFTRTVCSSPVCFPSRTAVFSGVHPVRSGAISNFNWGRPWRFYVPDATTLPKHLSQYGWRTVGGGKNFHDRNQAEFDVYRGRPREVKAIEGSGYFAGPLGWGVSSVPYEQMPDYRVVSWGIERLNESSDRPVFLSLGIYRPHVPWILPQESFDKYPLDSFDKPKTTPNDLADVAERLKLLAHNEAKFDRGFHKKLERDGQDRAWARAYLASVTFADEQLGRVLDAWDASGHAEGGYIVLWSDHGFMLGEKQGWGKFKPWYDACRSNMIIVGPGVEAGVLCDKAVSLQDLYPTLVELLEVPRPAHAIDGNSLVPLLRDAEMDWDKPVVMSHEEDGVRYDVVLDNRYRLTQVITGERELYDHRSDPHEWHNLADDPKHASTIERLSGYLTFHHAAPPADGWLEAESLPAQTSADWKRRGNFHYPVSDTKASGGRMVHAELRQKAKSYIDFVVDVRQPGAYELGLRVQHVTANAVFSVSVDDVEDAASQATAEHPMRVLNHKIDGRGREIGSMQNVLLGGVTFEKPGLKIVRIMSEEDRSAELRIDRVYLKPTDG